MGEKSLDVRLHHVPEASILQSEAQGLHRVPGTDPYLLAGLRKRVILVERARYDRTSQDRSWIVAT